MSCNPGYVEDNGLARNFNNTPDRKDSSASSIGKIILESLFQDIVLCRTYLYLPWLSWSPSLNIV